MKIQNANWLVKKFIEKAEVPHNDPSKSLIPRVSVQRGKVSTDSRSYKYVTVCRLHWLNSGVSNTDEVVVSLHSQITRYDDKLKCLGLTIH